MIIQTLNYAELLLTGNLENLENNVGFTNFGVLTCSSLALHIIRNLTNSACVHMFLCMCRPQGCTVSCVSQKPGGRRQRGGQLKQLTR